MAKKIFWFIIYDGSLLCWPGPKLPHTKDAEPPPGIILSGEVMDIGGPHGLGGQPCRAAVAASKPGGWLALSLLEVHEAFGQEVYLLAAKAVQLAYWRQNSQFCPVCGKALAPHHTATAMACGGCGKMMFPKPTAAVLVLVEKKNSLLLVRAHNFRGPFYGLVAGYLDQGESLEDCARREVMEETGLQIKNLRYFGSDPWPFPNNIMIGFSAEYAGGKIRLQEEELAEAAFFTREAMPALPRPLSLTRRMIDWWINGKEKL